MPNYKFEADTRTTHYYTIDVVNQVLNYCHTHKNIARSQMLPLYVGRLCYNFKKKVRLMYAWL